MLKSNGQRIKPQWGASDADKAGEIKVVSPTLESAMRKAAAAGGYVPGAVGGFGKIR